MAKEEICLLNNQNMDDDEFQVMGGVSGGGRGKVASQGGSGVTSGRGIA